MKNQTLVKMPDGTIKKFFGRKSQYMANKFVEANPGAKLLKNLSKQ